MILITLPLWTDNIAQAEQLLDFLYAQNDRVALATHALIVHPPAVDREMLERIKISAELAFKGVHLLELRALADERAPKWKQINNAFTQAATHIHKGFRWPFFWLEPDCVPLRKGWLPRLVLEYGSQPKSYFGSRLKIETPGKPDAFLMARNAIYPVNAIADLPAADAPFEIASAVNVFPKFTISKLIQQTVINNEADLAKVRADAIVVHGDKNGFLRRKLEAEFVPKVEESPASDVEFSRSEWTNKVSIPIAPGEPPVVEPIPVNGVAAKRRGRPTKAEIAARNATIAATFTA